MKSDSVKNGMQTAPQRSLFNALGMTKEELDKPLVGIVSSYNEIVPGHMNLDKIVEAVKLGVAMAGGTPVVFPAIAVCDGIAMGHVGMKYSLVTRDLIADSTECMAMAHAFDALVMVPNCDKNVPGLLMAAARINVPTVFVSGGPMLAGHINGHKTSLSSMFEAVGAYAAGKLDEEGWIYITGRLNNLILFSNGKNVYPEEIETEISRIYGVGEVVVYAGESKAHPECEVIVAEIYPEFDNLKERGITDVKAYLTEKVKEANANMAPYKAVKLVKIRNTEFPKNTSRKIIRFGINKSID